MHPYKIRTLIIPAFAGLLSVSGLLASPALAELKKCNGVWTNKPCESKSGPSLSEIPYREPSPAEQSLKERKRLLYALETSATTLRGKGGTIDLAVTRELCLGQNTTTEECREAIINKEKEINAALLVVAVQPTPERAAVVPLPDGQANVTVVDNRDQWSCSGHRRPHGRRDFNPHDPSPELRPQPGQPGLPASPEPVITPAEEEPSPGPNVSRWGSR